VFGDGVQPVDVHVRVAAILLTHGAYAFVPERLDGRTNVVCRQCNDRHIGSRRQGVDIRVTSQTRDLAIFD
jgi:hypothetical protein